MYNNVNDMLMQIPNIMPANEAEVETKILLHIFRFLNYTDIDRADKPYITMHFGREQKEKIPDFIFYDGRDRTPSKALISVEAKAIGESLEGAELQVKSYATFAVTPYYVVCNGEDFIASRFTPGADVVNTIGFRIKEIEIYWDDLRKFLQRAEVLLFKERLQYQAKQLPSFEELPASEFHKMYLSELHHRFSSFDLLRDPLAPPLNGRKILPNIPVSVRMEKLLVYNDKGLADFLFENNEHILIEGSAGSGKTTLCYRIVNHLSTLAQNRGADILPIYVKLSDGSPSSVLEALEKACKELGVPFYSVLYERSLQHNHVILILDGLDELLINTVNSGIRVFAKLLSENANSTIFITTRPLMFESDQFAIPSGICRGIVNSLTEAEVFEVLDQYKMTDKLDKFIQTTKFPINSPLILYMLINVIEKLQDVTGLTKFSLYREYVNSLHEYFNSSALRGGDRVILLDEILGILSDVSYLISGKREKRIKINLNDLKDALEASHKEDAVIAFLNTGLVTSMGNRVEFIHYSFEEFGIAYRIINCIKAKDIRGFIESTVPSESCYSMIYAELTESDKDELVSLLGHSKNKVRKRAMGVLKYSDNRAIIGDIRMALTNGSTGTAPLSVVQAVVKRDKTSIYWLLSLDKIRLSDKIVVIERLIQDDCYYAAKCINDIVDYSTQYDNNRIPTIIFKLCMKHINHDNIVKTFEAYYWKQSESTRLKICSMLRKNTNNESIYGFVSEILEREDSARVILRLLPFVASMSINSDVYIRINGILTVFEDFRSRDYKYINDFLVLTENRFSSPQIKDIRDICRIMIASNQYFNVCKPLQS
jgi:GTPase SAR1 family protein